MKIWKREAKTNLCFNTNESHNIQRVYLTLCSHLFVLFRLTRKYELIKRINAQEIPFLIFIYENYFFIINSMLLLFSFRVIMKIMHQIRNNLNKIQLLLRIGIWQRMQSVNTVFGLLLFNAMDIACNLKCIGYHTYIEINKK